jgi:flagellar motility protein MotE (MotC chaperone)
LDLSRQLERIREKEEEMQQKMEALTEEIGGFHSSQNSVAQYVPDEVTSMFETLSFTPDKA